MPLILYELVPPETGSFLRVRGAVRKGTVTGHARAIHPPEYLVVRKVALPNHVLRCADASSSHLFTKLVSSVSTDSKKRSEQGQCGDRKPRWWPAPFPAWQWESNLIWRSCCLFFLGSMLFTLSCSTGLFQIMANHSWRNRLCVAYPYAAGSVLYTWGAYYTVVASTDVLRELETQRDQDASLHLQSAAMRRPEQVLTAGGLNTAAVYKNPPGKVDSSALGSLAAPCGGNACSSGASLSPGQLSNCAPSCSKQSVGPVSADRSIEERYRECVALKGPSDVLRGSASDLRMKAHFRWRSSHEWAVLELTGAGIVWVGTLLYNSSCFTPAVLASLTANMPAHTLAALLQWAVKVPNIIAGCFFVLGSYVAWACAVRSFSLLHIWQQRLPIGSFWAYALYLMGSVGFLSGAILSEPVFVLSASVLIDEWFGMFVGYFFGSLCFLLGSYLGMSAIS